MIPNRGQHISRNNDEKRNVRDCNANSREVVAKLVAIVLISRSLGAIAEVILIELFLRWALHFQLPSSIHFFAGEG